MRMLDLFCGRFGAGRVFAERGWDVLGFDIVPPPEIHPGCKFVQKDILTFTQEELASYNADFLWASSPCEEFSVWGQRHFHPNPKFPDMGLVLFCYTRRLFERSGLPFVMENVRPAQRFVGNAVNHLGSFFLWGSAVPPLLPQGISKGYSQVGRKRAESQGGDKDPLLYIAKEERAARIATIPPELALTVCDFVERLIEQRVYSLDSTTEHTLP